MAYGFKENDFQHGVFLPFFTAPEPAGLNWMEGKPTDIDRDKWIVPADLLEFLKNGCPQNAAAFKQASKPFDSDVEFLNELWASVLAQKLRDSANAAVVLRDNLVFQGQTFVLWNEAPRAGADKSAQALFETNRLRVIAEATFERHFPLTNKRIKRRPDVVFFVNGLYFAYAELKTAQTGQTAASNGRKKIAHNCIEAAICALNEARERYAAQGGVWPGFRSRNLQEAERHRIRQDICLYERATHISSIDMGNLMIVSDTDWLLGEVDDALLKDHQIALSATIPDKLIECFARAPEMRDKSPSTAVQEHLASMFHPAHGIDREIHFFNQLRASRTTSQVEMLRPRPAQRAMLYQAMCRVDELYANEGVAKINEADIRAQLTLALPDLAPAKADAIVNDTLLHRNGAEAHTILLQGAAGLGKTNVMVWLAQALSDKVDKASGALAGLFDLCILLTDRTELRKNVASEAQRSKGVKNITAEAETFADLRDALDGGARIVVVNIQKFPSIQKLAEQDAKLNALLTSKRVAFIIDEVHRSQNGKLHDATVEVFDQWGSLRPQGVKRNLIIGLTATPRDEVLARFGEWRSPSAPGDNIRWVPYFAYTMAQAIREKIILNPIQNILRYEDHLIFKATDTIQKIQHGQEVREPSTTEIYSNAVRQGLIAKHAALVFAAKTIRAVRPPNRALGDGKAMFAADSIRAAISYQKLLRLELDELAFDPRFAEYGDSLRATPVLVLFTDKQGEDSCASFNGGKNQDAILDEFRRKGEAAKAGLQVFNAIIVVVDKLLTGFDEPTLHTLFLDRGMDDVLLFQSACRVDRTCKYKQDCLLVDFSHEGVVSKNLPKVFEKYGGITVSDLDAMSLRDKMDEAFNQFFRDKDLSQHWKTWKATRGAGKTAQGAKELSDFLDTLMTSEEGLLRAASLRKLGTAWLGSREKLRIILDFTKPELHKHDEPMRIEFAEQVVRHLAAKTKEVDNRVAAVFDVDLVAESEGFGWDELPTASENNKKKSAAPPGTPQSALALAASLDAITLLAALSLTEQQKLELIEKLKAFLQVLFGVVDTVGKNVNQDVHRKMVMAMHHTGADFAWEDRYAMFKTLLDSATLNPKIYMHAHRKAFIEPLLKRAELVMADYEEWVVSAGASIVLSSSAS